MARDGARLGTDPDAPDTVIQKALKDADTYDDGRRVTTSYKFGEEKHDYVTPRPAPRPVRLAKP